jgi:hypothetical protein
MAPEDTRHKQSYAYNYAKSLVVTTRLASSYKLLQPGYWAVEARLSAALDALRAPPWLRGEAALSSLAGCGAHTRRAAWRASAGLRQAWTSPACASAPPLTVT